MTRHISPTLLHAACAALLVAGVTGQAPDQEARLRSMLPAHGPVGAVRAADGSIRAEGPTWQANFSPAGAAFEVAAGPARDEVAALQLRYLGTRRGDTWLAADATPRSDLGDRIVRTQHGPVVETYTLRGEGIEQSFHFGTCPEGHGDLVIDIAAAGNVSAKPTAASRHQPLEFRLGDASAIRYGEAFAFDRTGSRVEVSTHYDGAGRIQLIVPRDFVDGAHYPLVVDPVIGAVLLPSGTGYTDGAPDVAHDVEQDLFLVVWQRYFSSTSQGIRAAIYNGDGTVVNPFIAIAIGNGLQAPAVAFTRSLNSNSFLVVWEQPSGIQGRLVTASSGAMPAASFAVSSPGVGVLDRRPTVSGPDGAMMVAWDRTASGETQPQSIVLRDLYWLNPASPTTISYGPERTLQSTVTGNVMNVRLARSNVATQVGGVNWYANRIVWQRFFVSPAPGDNDVYSMAFRMKSGPFDYAVLDSATTVPGAGDVGPNEMLPDIGSRASIWQNPTDMQFLVAWQDESDVLGQMFDLDGSIGSTITVRASADFEGQPAVGAGACEFTVAYLQITPPDEFDVDVYAARVLLDGSVPQDHSLVDNPGSQYQDHVRASSRPIHTSSQFQRNTSLLAWMGQTGTTGEINDVRARFFEPVGASSSLYGTACAGPGGTLPAIGWTGGEPYPGNDAYAVTLSNAPPAHLAALLVGTSLISVPIPGAPGCTLYTDLPFIAVLPAITDGAGNATIALPMPCSLPLSPIAMQWGVLTPGWNAFGWITSNDIDVSWFD
jgi:hypothetical protein